MESTQAALEEYKKQLDQALSKMDKAAYIQSWTSLLAQKIWPIPSLYEEILVPSLNQIGDASGEQSMTIWEEHLRSALVRTALELAYPYVLEAREDNRALCGKALVLCLEEEYHELGARMVSDYLTLLGFDPYFIGANTPNKEILEAVHDLSPRLVVISLTNFYHLFKLQDLMDAIKKASRQVPYIVLGGYAIDHTPEAHRLVNPDYFAATFRDYVKMKEVFSWD